MNPPNLNRTATDFEIIRSLNLFFFWSNAGFCESVDELSVLLKAGNFLFTRTYYCTTKVNREFSIHLLLHNEGQQGIFYLLTTA